MFPILLILSAAVAVSAPALSSGSRALGVSALDEVLEPVSETPFAVRRKTPLEARELTLAGTGLRTKTFLHVKVYAMGLYVEAGPAAWTLRDWKGRSHKELTKDGGFYTELLKPNFTKSLRLVLQRNIDGDDMREAFEDSLAPRVKRAAKEFGMPGGEKALQAFRAYFALDTLKKKTELVFTWFPDGRLVTQIEGKVVGTQRNPALAWALFDIYLGGKPIETEAKRGLIERLPQLLRDTEPVAPPAKPEGAAATTGAGSER